MSKDTKTIYDLTAAYASFQDIEKIVSAAMKTLQLAILREGVENPMTDKLRRKP